MDNKKFITKIIIILLIGGLASVLVLTALNSSTVKVVVASGEIIPGDEFTSSNLTTIDMPKNSVIEGVTILDINDVLGKTSNGYLANNEMVSYSRVSDTKSESYLANMENKDSNYAVQLTVSTDNPIVGVSIGDYVSLVSTIKAPSGDTSATNKVGDKYKIIGINTNVDSGLISSLTLEVAPENLSEVSHIILNEQVLVAIVDEKNSSKGTIGTTQENLYNKASGSTNN